MHAKGVLLCHKRYGRRCGIHVGRLCCKQMTKQCMIPMTFMILGIKDHRCSNQHNSMVPWLNEVN